VHKFQLLSLPSYPMPRSEVAIASRHLDRSGEIFEMSDKTAVFFKNTINLSAISFSTKISPQPMKDWFRSR